MVLGYKMKDAGFDSRDFKDDLSEAVIKLVKQTAELGDLDLVFEARMWGMDGGDLRQFQEAISAHIKDGQFDDAVIARAKAIGYVGASAP